MKQNCQAKKELFFQQKEDEDIHSLTASQIFNIDIKKVNQDHRRKAKAINFGIIYGISQYGLAKQINVSNYEAEEFLDAYFAKFPEIKVYMDGTIKFCRKSGYVNNIFGRRSVMKEQVVLKNISDFENKSLLIVDDDNPFRERLARAMEKKGFEVSQAESVQKGVESVKVKKPGFAVVDLRLGDGNGLEVVKEIQTTNSESRIIMLTGYGNIPTAVAAIKEGAIDYLAKPADAEDVEKALLADPAKKAAPPENPMSADRVKWEHIHRVFELCNRNVSETARRLKMHRRTLQRILSKRSPR